MSRTQAETRSRFMRDMAMASLGAMGKFLFAGALTSGPAKNRLTRKQRAGRLRNQRRKLAKQQARRRG